MPEESVFWLHSISVVVTAQSHNPSILNRDFLVLQEIVPESWEVIEAVTTPAVSLIRYKKGIQLVVDEEKLTVVENCKSSFQDEYLATYGSQCLLGEAPTCALSQPWTQLQDSDETGGPPRLAHASLLKIGALVRRQAHAPQHDTEVRCKGGRRRVFFHIQAGERAHRAK